MEAVCRIKGCGRPTVARELCQSHLKQLQKAERTHNLPWKPTPIRERRKVEGNRIQWRGFSIEKEVVHQLEKEAKSRKLSPAALVVEILTEWVRNRRNPPYS